MILASAASSILSTWSITKIFSSHIEFQPRSNGRSESFPRRFSNYSIFFFPSTFVSSFRIAYYRSVCGFESCIEFLVTVTVEPRSRRNRGGKFARNERVRGMPVEVFARPVTYRVHTPGKAGRRVSVSRHRGNRRG